MHFDVVCLYLFIHAHKSGGELSIRAELTRLSVCVCMLQMCVCVCASDVCVCVHVLQMCVCACASDVCAGNSARLLLQQSRASFMLASCLRAVLISSPDTWDWTRMHALAVMHRRTLCGQWQNKDAFLYYRYRYFTAWHRCIVSIHIDEFVTSLFAMV